MPKKGEASYLTEVLERAMDIATEQLAETIANYATPPLTVREIAKRGRALLRFPDDPETATPEQMQVLVNVHGREAVGRWLQEHYAARAEREVLGIEEEE